MLWGILAEKRSFYFPAPTTAAHNLMGVFPWPFSLRIRVSASVYGFRVNPQGPQFSGYKAAEGISHFRLWALKNGSMLHRVSSKAGIAQSLKGPCLLLFPLIYQIQLVFVGFYRIEGDG
ncbi:MAG: hypothetical protein LBP22_10360 [Deltaproteobacteria bacterium]|jgi:hypothetical protein|nr:hypothetical protein [Deltaproteobacteria bacterium]